MHGLCLQSNNLIFYMPVHFFYLFYFYEICCFTFIIYNNSQNLTRLKKRVRVMMFNATFNNISVTSGRRIFYMKRVNIKL